MRSCARCFQGSSTGGHESRVQLSVGKQAVLDPAPKAGKLLYFMDPYAEADDKSLNEDLYGFNIGYTITFKER